MGRKARGPNLDPLVTDASQMLCWACKEAFLHRVSKQKWEWSIPGQGNRLPVNIWVYQTPRECRKAVGFPDSLELVVWWGDRRGRSLSVQDWGNYRLWECLSLPLGPSGTIVLAMQGPPVLPSWWVMLIFVPFLLFPWLCSGTDSSSQKWVPAFAS